MAAPATKTLKNISGNWILNQKTSDSFEPMLVIQGVSWWKRQALSLVTVTEHTKQFVDDKGVETILIDSTITGGFKGTSQCRPLDGSVQSIMDDTFGLIKETNTWSDLSDINNKWLKEGWLQEQDGADREHIKVVASNEGFGWSSVAVWGFSEINGQRWHVRKVSAVKDGKQYNVRAVYDWLPTEGSY